MPMDIQRIKVTEGATLQLRSGTRLIHESMDLHDCSRTTATPLQSRQAYAGSINTDL